MTDQISENQLTSALEDYLETIYLFTQKQGFVRVRDISRARNVKAGSVSPAMKRLSDLGLIDYAQREYIKLTDEGTALARKILSRHHVLTRFFTEVLKMDSQQAEDDACAMEHSLSSIAMDSLVKLLEFLTICPHSPLKYWEKFVENIDSNNHTLICRGCEDECIYSSERTGLRHPRTIKDLAQGESSTIIAIEGNEETRHKLLDFGLLPEATVFVDHFVNNKNEIHLRVNDYSLVLNTNDASRVIIR